MKMFENTTDLVNAALKKGGYSDVVPLAIYWMEAHKEDGGTVHKIFFENEGKPDDGLVYIDKDGCADY